jgi:hypothetical protein
VKRLNFNFRTTAQRAFASYSVIGGVYIGAKAAEITMIRFDAWTLVFYTLLMIFMAGWIFTGERS